MSILQIIRVVFILPFAWLSAIWCRKKPIETRYTKLKSYSSIVLRLLGYKLEAEGIENIPQDKAVFFVSNHQGTLDPALVVKTCPVPVAFISKEKNEKLPVFGSWAKTIDVIHFDPDTREGNIFMLRSSARRLKDGRNLLIFPEGTRSKGDKMNEFKVGAMQPAYLAKAIILPVTLNNAYCIDDKADKNRNLKITYGKPLYYEEYKDYTQEEIAQVLFNKIEANIDYKHSV